MKRRLIIIFFIAIIAVLVLMMVKEAANWSEGTQPRDQPYDVEVIYLNQVDTLTITHKRYLRPYYKFYNGEELVAKYETIGETHIVVKEILK